MIELKITGVTVPGSAVTVMVKVCGVSISFVSESGLMAMLASTKFLSAVPLPAGPSSVVVAGSYLASGTPGAAPMVTLPAALRLNAPVLLLLIVTVHVATLPLALTVGVAHVVLSVY